MRLIPREEKFFELFLDQIKIIAEAARLLHGGVQAGNSSLKLASEKIAVLENQADDIIHEIFRKLNQTFITPLDPEDIHSLSSRLDDVIDGLEDLAYRIVAYKIDPIPAPLIEGCRELTSCVASLQKAFGALQSNQKLVEHCIEVNRIEEIVDVLTRRAIKDLFSHEKDPIQLIKLKEIYEVLEATTDSCEDVAVALQNVVVKNS